LKEVLKQSSKRTWQGRTPVIPRGNKKDFNSWNLYATLGV
jgi:hypothetical protein